MKALPLEGGGGCCAKQTANANNSMRAAAIASCERASFNEPGHAAVPGQIRASASGSGKWPQVQSTRVG